MKTTRFFRTLFLLAGAAIIPLACSTPPSESRGVSQTPKPSDWKLGHFESLTGAGVLYAPITLGTESYGSSGYSDYSGRSGSAGFTGNYLFVRTTDKSSHFLLASNRGLVRTLLPLRVGIVDPSDESSDSKKLRVEWLYVEYASQDSNKDNKLNAEDAFSVGFARPDGTDYHDVLTNIDEVLGTTRSAPNTFLLVYRQQKNIQVAEIDIPSRKVLVTKPLPALHTP